MASSKKVTKEDLRKAMLEAKKKHQLVCVVCKLVVKSEAVWAVHLNSKVHKENTELLKKGVKPTLLKPVEKTTSSVLKRSSSTSINGSSEPKKLKGILKKDPDTTGNQRPSVPDLPDDFFDSSKSVTSTISAVSVNPTSSNIDSGTINVVKAEKSNPIIEPPQENREPNSTNLPEGFFDDPKMDAKARHVEYKDPKEEEWEKFQKEIKEQEEQSALIICENQEEAAEERQIDVIEEQMRNWSRVLKLVERKEKCKVLERKESTSDSDSDDENVDEFLDWRAKKS
ncbi:hypothetical protein TKK_0018966 [Trichogramma kaykai]|uniref:Zinc finger protein 830 n=1 Tax=Trichogramma kaykai TaxID=54128 RepID=A0ABD2VVB6_9HYME